MSFFIRNFALRKESCTDNLQIHNKTMRKIISLAIASLCAMSFVLSSCAVKKASVVSLCGNWSIGAYVDQASNELQTVSETYEVSFASDSTFYCATDCNSLHSRYMLDGENLQFGFVASTRMACPTMDVEQNMGMLLPLVRTFKIEGADLYLLDENRQTLVVLHPATAAEQ